jgi:hypothetical protein
MKKLNFSKLIKNYDNKDEFEKFTSEKEILKFLLDKYNFVDFFNAIYKLKICFMGEDLLKLKNLLKKHIIFEYRYGHTSMIYIRDMIDIEIVLNVRLNKKINYLETEMRNLIIKNFYKIFKNFKFVQKEFTVNKIGKIDILAKEIKTNRDVIIEIKVKNKNPNKQLISYGNEFKNPILIGITEEKLNENNIINNILYYTFDELMNGLKVK